MVAASIVISGMLSKLPEEGSCGHQHRLVKPESDRFKDLFADEKEVEYDQDRYQDGQSDDDLLRIERNRQDCDCGNLDYHVSTSGGPIP
ncbi:MAG: hypothetical protein RQM90_01995 [Methanoculleus sp.]